MSSGISWWEPLIQQAECDMVRDVLASNYLNDGRVTRALEGEFVNLLGCQHAVATTSGTAALALSLMALGIGAGDEVLVPDITFIATANAVTLCGAKAVLVDVDTASLGMCPVDFAKKINGATKAVIPVHVSGRATTLDLILKEAENHNLFIVEDAAEALGSRYNGKFLGTFGHAGCYSLSPNKTITSGQGGVIVTNDAQIHNRLRELKDQGRPVQGTGGDDVHDAIGFNFKLTNLQAAVGVGQFLQLEGRLERLRRNYSLYKKELQETQEVRLFPVAIEEGETPQWTDGMFEKRDALYDHLAERGIQCRKFWYPLHQSKPYRGEDRDFPNSTQAWKRAMWLPSSFRLKDEDVVRVCTAIREFYRG